MSDSSKFNRDINSPLIKKSIFVLLEKSSIKILLVEGKGDRPFYSRFVNSSVIISEVTKTKDYSNEQIGIHDSDYNQDGNISAKDFLQFIVDKQQKIIKKSPLIKYGSCYGIIDKDYEGINTKSYPDMGSFITCTDQRDLEATLISFGQKIVENRFYCDFNYDAKGVQKRTLERSKEDRQRPKRDSVNYAVSMFRIKPEVSRLRIASESAGSFWSPMKSPQSSAGY